MFGCGCWVEDNFKFENDNSETDRHSVAICTTGCGEYIIKTLFSKQCVDHILDNTDKLDYDLAEFYRKKFFSKYIYFI